MRPRSWCNAWFGGDWQSGATVSKRGQEPIDTCEIAPAVTLLTGVAYQEIQLAESKHPRAKKTAVCITALVPQPRERAATDFRDNRVFGCPPARFGKHLVPTRRPSTNGVNSKHSRIIGRCEQQCTAVLVNRPVGRFNRPVAAFVNGHRIPLCRTTAVQLRGPPCWRRTLANLPGGLLPLRHVGETGFSSSSVIDLLVVCRLRFEMYRHHERLRCSICAEFPSDEWVTRPRSDAPSAEPRRKPGDR
jgi:hypothetical protein